ncbi:MAG: metal ABC transporter substrate-binding protein [Alphaproteobacteria bacterium]|nr:metal ABC transporter substrate-binding protein [Alphaproteobacteria bacterium]
MLQKVRLAAAVLAVLIGAVTPSLAQTRTGPIKVVASFSILADMVRTVGGDKVQVQSLVGPDADAHAYQPTPADAKAVAAADIVVVNGLGFEGWLGRLVKAAESKATVVTASQGIKTVKAAGGHNHGHGHGHRAADPHAWQDVGRGQAYVKNIAAALAKADAANAAIYQANAERYVAELAQLDTWVKTELGAIPAAKRKVITSHDAFAYFAEAYGVSFLSPVGVSTEKEPTAKDVAKLVRQVKNTGVKAIFVENMTDARLVEQLAKEAGGVIGGTLYADALSKPGGMADSYVKMVRHNVAVLRDGMAKN